MAANWEGRLEESRRKHAALAMIIEAKEEEKMRKAELTQKKWKRAGLDATETIGSAMRAKLAAEEAANRIAAELMKPKPATPKVEKEAVANTNTTTLVGGRRVVDVDNLDSRTKELYTHSKLLSKTKQKLKEQKKTAETEELEAAAGKKQQQAEQDKLQLAAEKEAAELEQTGIIGSIEEYASLVGKTVHQLAEARYDPPEVSESSEEAASEDEEAGDDLWGAIMGK